ncbi:hypothetical protein [Aneurinibacillus tyrosinisolvens]|uniref:hypothetical protein n=1 Tax=Aneurinibacillus tyrosinisolvens TaxID=1443435 RepID=UPI00063EF5FE|nr:hypothetical protein [Aneurinibacillus tyrosinisolvens]
MFYSRATRDTLEYIRYLNEREAKLAAVRKGCFDLLERQWQNFKDALIAGEIKYNDINDLKKVQFIRQFDDMLRHERKHLDIRLTKVNNLHRAAKNSAQEDYQRFIPNPAYKSLNRMNPPDKLFIYLGYDNEQRQYNDSLIIPNKPVCGKFVLLLATRLLCVNLRLQKRQNKRRLLT